MMALNDLIGPSAGPFSRTPSVPFHVCLVEFIPVYCCLLGDLKMLAAVVHLLGGFDHFHL